MKSIISLKIVVSTFFILMIIKGIASPSDITYSVKAYICADKSVTIKEIQKNTYADRFFSGEEIKFAINDSKCTNWVCIELNNRSSESCIINSSIFYYDITAYFFNEDMQLLDSILTGYNISTKKKHIKTASNALIIPLNKKIKCYIKFKTYIPTGIDFCVYKNTDFINLKTTEHTFNGVVNGIFFLAMIYSALFAMLLWKRIYLFYMLYVSSFWVFMLSINLETSLYFSWLQWPFGLGFYIVPHYILTISLILYTCELLQLKAFLPIFLKINFITTCFIAILLVVYLTTGWSWHDSELNTLALLPSFIASILLIVKKYKPAWFVLLGLSLIFIAFLSIRLNMDQYIPTFFTFTFYGVIELIVFGISITYWWKTLVMEKEKALNLALSSAEEITKIKENQNMFLEQEVAIKTQELKLANQKLGVYIKQVENLNQYLETDNDKLKIKVIDQIKARSDDKIMNFEDFKINFPDDDSCYAHIENIKWANGFVCLKCGNNKYSDRKLAKTTPARRCTKCGFVNTVPSNTLYHNIKFPLQKAFYITYMIGTNKSKTLEELSKELDLRTGTIHGFMKKVKEASNSFTAKKKHKDGWTHLIGFSNNATTKNKDQKI